VADKENNTCYYLNHHSNHWGLNFCINHNNIKNLFCQYTPLYITIIKRYNKNSLINKRIKIVKKWLKYCLFLYFPGTGVFFFHFPTIISNAFLGKPGFQLFYTFTVLGHRRVLLKINDLIPHTQLALKRIKPPINIVPLTGKTAGQNPS
jgi:hypothetical protein